MILLILFNDNRWILSLVLQFWKSSERYDAVSDINIRLVSLLTVVFFVLITMIFVLITIILNFMLTIE